jgi:type IV pilus assembly protein PilB
MVLSTLHTNSAPATLTRLANMGVPAFNIASAVELIVAQRLARRLCENCKQPVELPKNVLLDAGFKPQDLKGLTIFKAKGCDNCSMGYKGRIGIYQVMPVTEEIQTIILNGGTELQIEEAALAAGVNDLRLSGLERVKEGITSLEEIERVTNV